MTWRRLLSMVAIFALFGLLTAIMPHRADAAPEGQRGGHGVQGGHNWAGGGHIGHNNWGRGVGWGGGFWGRGFGPVVVAAPFIAPLAVPYTVPVPVPVSVPVPVAAPVYTQPVTYSAPSCGCPTAGP